MFWVEKPWHCYFDVLKPCPSSIWVCVGLRSGPKGPVVDVSICGVALGPFDGHSPGHPRPGHAQIDTGVCGRLGTVRESRTCEEGRAVQSFWDLPPRTVGPRRVVVGSLCSPAEPAKVSLALDSAHLPTE